MQQAASDNSTNVRFFSDQLRRVARLSPPMGALVAEGLFTVTRRFQRPDRETAWLSRATPFDLVVRGRTLAAWQWGTGPSTVLLVHGWQGRGSQLGAMVEPLVRAGHRVVAFDAAGHGDSPGFRSTIVDFSEAISEAARKVGGLQAVIAHSLGGAALTLALKDGLAVEAVVLIAPPASPRPLMRTISDHLNLGQAAREAFVTRVEQRVGRKVVDVEVPQTAAALRVPALIVHDRDDREVPFASGEAIARAWPGAELLPTEGLGHSRILRDPATVDRATRFVLDRVLAPELRDLDRWFDAIEERRLYKRRAGLPAPQLAG